MRILLLILVCLMSSLHAFSYEILSRDYAKENGIYLYDINGNYVKTYLVVKFINDISIESTDQYYEVDGCNEEDIQSKLELASEEYNARSTQ